MKMLLSKNKFYRTFILVFAILTSLFAFAAKSPIQTVEKVELKSYLGLWYEVERIENRFQDNEPKAGEGPCYNTTAEYSILPDNKIQVKNTCFRKSDKEIAIAKARAVEGSNNSKLKVNFTGLSILEWLGIGNGDYWILALGKENADGLYSWALVGSPNLDYGWVLSRTPQLPDSDIQAALAVASSVGYDTKLFKSFLKK